MTTKEAVDTLCEALRTDEGYFYSWQANIAMQFQDAVSRAGYKFPDLHALSNEAAKNFLDLLIQQEEKKAHAVAAQWQSLCDELAWILKEIHEDGDLLPMAYGLEGGEEIRDAVDRILKKYQEFRGKEKK